MSAEAHPFNVWVRRVCASHPEQHVTCPGCASQLCLYWLDEDPADWRCPECGHRERTP